MPTSKAVLSSLALFAGATAHISMTQPVPFGKPDTSPLNADGSNYPCKTENGFKINSVTEIPAGKDQTMTFSGSAVHGGGSCQISLAKGFTPDASTQFKVVTSIEGACPGLDSATKGQTYKIPTDVANGEYTLAWTWFNNIGNREMYMNCAPVKVTGGGSGDAGFNSLPDMAIFNIASKNTCKTVETKDVKFPNPGANPQVVSKNLADPTNCGGAAAAQPAPAAGAGNSGNSGASSGTGTSGTNGGSGTGSANTGQYTGIGAGAGAGKPAPASSASSPAAAAPAPASTGAFAEGTNGSSSGNSSSTGSSSTGTPAGSSNGTSTGSSSTGSSSTGSSSGSTASGSSSSSSGSTATAGGACSGDGAIVCSPDGSQFGLCNWGKVMYQAVATGTKCQGGKIMRRHEFNA